MNFKTEENKLSDEQLVQYGEQLSNFREKIRTDAQNMFELIRIDGQDKTYDEMEKERYQAKQLANRMHKSSFNINSKVIENEYDYDYVPPSQRKIGCKRGVLTQEEKLEIVH